MTRYLLTATGGLLADREGEPLDAQCECDLGRACNYPPCVMDNDLFGRWWRGVYDREQTKIAFDAESLRLRDDIDADDRLLEALDLYLDQTRDEVRA